MHSGLKNAESRTVSSTAIESVRTYDAFGNVLSTASASWTGAFGYAGAFGYQEDPSGLKLLGHRYYDSETGRFISRDPAEDGRNWYPYCDNNPVVLADPAGLRGFGATIAMGLGRLLAKYPWLARLLGVPAAAATPEVLDDVTVAAPRTVELTRVAGETAMELGRRAHAALSHPYRGNPDFRVDRWIGLVSRKRPDIVEVPIRHILEFKPNNERAIREGHSAGNGVETNDGGKERREVYS
jgi:RHS repeat-associated protein